MSTQEGRVTVREHWEYTQDQIAKDDEQWGRLDRFCRQVVLPETLTVHDRDIDYVYKVPFLSGISTGRHLVHARHIRSRVGETSPDHRGILVITGSLMDDEITEWPCADSRQIKNAAEEVLQDTVEYYDPARPQESSQPPREFMNHPNRMQIPGCSDVAYMPVRDFKTAYNDIKKIRAKPLTN